ncbi:class I SAM-dependent methyltransferase [Alcaligenaceae bacterium B3P038]|nr:class I SAM-dependent methyltransferase [Alcaligenaceae bacterium B3P038]
MSATATIEWMHEDGSPAVAWESPSGAARPKRMQVADDRMSADAAYRLICGGTSLLWQGDYHNARALVDALGRRVEKRRRAPDVAAAAIDRFNAHRQAQSHRAHIMNAVLVPVDASWQVALRRAPDTRAALVAWHGNGAGPAIMSLRAVQGVLSAAEWERKGIPIAALDATIHPRFGVYSPLRGEYIDLVMRAPLPEGDTAFDLGTGTGVLAIALAKRGVKHIRATEIDPRAVACARDNIARVVPRADVQVITSGELYPSGRASLIVCNPPWLPGRPTTPIEGALYDPDSQMLNAFLRGLPDHLAPQGEGWLILSDLAVHLGLRAPGAVVDVIAAAGLDIIDRLDIRPRHGKANDAVDPLAFARTQEVTSLWRLSTKRSGA